MSELGHHTEWLSLIDISGPFLAEPVLKDAFPQGLEGLDPAKKTTVSQAYDEWREALDLDDPDLPKFHHAWIDLILKNTLELSDVLKAVDKLPDTVRCELPEHGITLRPDYAVMDTRADARPLILIAIYGSETSLTDTLKGDGWTASPAERMVELCRATDVRLGLVANGEQWMLVDAPVGAVTSFASWYARLWGQEPVTLQAFINLLGVRRFFVDRSEQLPALLDNSLKFQDEVTEALGEQVRRAVEVLIQALDRADVDRNRELLDGIESAELYEAGLTVMMRIVFLLSAEERGLLLLGDQRYEANYAVSTLRMQLRGESEEILERRWDAWARLLSIFRAVYGGVDHEAMRLPALGGSLFDPDRFPFLEGRRKTSRWKIDPATPLPIDNRTVLYLLDAVQLFQGRTLSYLALDIEQIGYVYEGLLERTVVRAKEATLDLDATKNAKHPWVSLPELDDAAAKGRQGVEELLKDRTASSASRVRNDLDKTVDEGSADKLLTACHADRSLRDRIRPYFHLLRTDRWGYPIVYPKGAFMVTSGEDRRETGTHYTPKSFTEAIVKATLEPLVYAGPAEGKSREEWVLKSSAELLDLKICDPAMGSGAFLVQVCRWLSERLVEAWVHAENQGKGITSEGEVVDEIGSQEPLRKDAAERLLIGRRLIAERCLYGVDMNPLAVELAKLSIWLVTLAKGRPFGFLDHNLRCGDSLLGITNIEQLHYLDLNTGKGSTKKLFASNIDQAVTQAIELRSELRSRPIRDIRDVEVMAQLDDEARRKLQMPQLIADLLVGEALMAGPSQSDTTPLSIEVGSALTGDQSNTATMSSRARTTLGSDLPKGKAPRRPFHWPIEFPEVFSTDNGGFSAIVGNPPYMGGRVISSNLGQSYYQYLGIVRDFVSGSPDLAVFFLLQGFRLIKTSGCLGFVTTSAIKDTGNKDVGFRQIQSKGGTIYFACPAMPWPGTASVIVSQFSIWKGTWNGKYHLSSVQVPSISAGLDAVPDFRVGKIRSMEKRKSDGFKLMGEGFVLSEPEMREVYAQDADADKIIRPYFGGDDIVELPCLKPYRWVIDFEDKTEKEALQWPFAFNRVVQLVKPFRDGQTGQIHQDCFWKFWDMRPKLRRVQITAVPYLVMSSVSKYIVVRRYVGKAGFNQKTKAIFYSDFASFGVLQSTVHDVWARWASGSRGITLSYSTSKALDTFPMPDRVNSELEEGGRRYYEFRDEVLISRNIGPTTLYNETHSKEVHTDDVQKMRALLVEMDCQVVTAYGWDDLELAHGFYEVPYLPDHDRLRFTVSEKARLEIINRLVGLNNIRCEHSPRTIRGAEASEIDEVAMVETPSAGLFAMGGGKA